MRRRVIAGALAGFLAGAIPDDVEPPPPGPRPAEEPSIIGTAGVGEEIELISSGPGGRGVDRSAVARGPVVLVVAVEVVFKAV